MASAAPSIAVKPARGDKVPYPGNQWRTQPGVFPGQPKGHLVRVVCMKPSGSAAESLAEVFRCRRSELVRLAAFILGDRPAAEDVVQEVFLRMHQRGTGSPSWMIRCRTCAARWSTAAGPCCAAAC